MFFLITKLLLDAETKRDHGQKIIQETKVVAMSGVYWTGFEINVIVSFDWGCIVRIIFSNGPDSFSAVLERTMIDPKYIQ